MEILYGGVDDGVRGGESDVVAHDLVGGSRLDGGLGLGAWLGQRDHHMGVGGDRSDGVPGCHEEGIADEKPGGNNEGYEASEPVVPQSFKEPE